MRLRMASVTVRDVVKRFGEVQVIHGASFDIRDGELIVLVGPSGCGKSTMLRMIAGLEDITGGEIAIGTKIVNNVPPRDRDVAMVFQDYALYPHMSVEQNIGFGLKMRGVARKDVRTQVQRAADILQIEHLLRRKPKQLSGGQRQRVAMGRAIVREPQVFLFDEPLSNLDAKLRIDMRTQIKRLHRQLGTTSVYVTHDQVEAMTLADRIVVLRDGVIEQLGPPDELYEHPANRFVAGFIGSPTMNFLPARVVARDGGLGVELAGGVCLPVPEARAPAYAAHKDRHVTLGIRPEHITDPASTRDGDVAAKLEVMIDVVEPLGSDTMIFARLGESDLVARSDPKAVGEVGGAMTLLANMSNMHLFDPESGAAL